MTAAAHILRMKKRCAGRPMSHRLSFSSYLFPQSVYTYKHVFLHGLSSGWGRGRRTSRARLEAGETLEEVLDHAYPAMVLSLNCSRKFVLPKAAKQRINIVSFRERFWP